MFVTITSLPHPSRSLPRCSLERGQPPTNPRSFHPNYVPSYHGLKYEYYLHVLFIELLDTERVSISARIILEIASIILSSFL
jgi:hypothetical protein